MINNSTNVEVNDFVRALFNDETIKSSDILEYVKINHQFVKLKPKTLGMLLEAYIDVIGWEDENNKISPDIEIEDLLKINVGFKSENGCQWARSDNSYIGMKYIVERKLVDGSVGIIKLNGLNDNLKKHRNIRADIVNVLKNQRCVILDIGTNIEIDHKNGRYDENNVMSVKTQKINDFQPLCKTANDAKRHHCKICIENQKRYNAQNLGYKEGWFKGTEDTTNCIGCYWHDPKKFNKELSKDFNKNDED